MEKIISELIERLTEQRDGLIMELRSLDEHKMNYHLKKTDISAEIMNIDNRIDTYLNKLPMPLIPFPETNNSK